MQDRARHRKDINQLAASIVERATEKQPVSEHDNNEPSDKEATQDK